MRDRVRIARLEQRMADNDKAMVLQAAEYQRRLDDLNHVFARIDSDRARFVPFDVYDLRHSELAKRQQDVEAWRSKVLGIAIGASVGFSIITAVIARLLVSR